MTGFTFAILSLFGVPAAVLALLILAHRLTPTAVWKTLPVQVLATLAFLSCIGLPMAIVQIDSQGDYFDDETALVKAAFALPEGVTVDRQGDKTVRLGDCWRNAVNWRSDVTFPNAAAFDRWYASQSYQEGIVRQVAGYFGQSPAQVSIAPDALAVLPRGSQYVLSDKAGSYQRNVRILEFYEPFLCAAIDRSADGTISLRRCDPIAEGGDVGNAGQVIVNPNAKKRTLEGRIYYASGPSICTNPVRRAVNNALGLPHPVGGEPNTSIGGNLPVM
ncbi:hypothetical protein [uncultured Erythrobacter sp.]|uniref:hypothetical protein n=1 Tax=uncultured Erythrobacter sp. TaxID=263913 RepID=UPI0026594B8F|nr:hypothetical protein [uncultured Erythrobacter sp.]